MNTKGYGGRTLRKTIRVETNDTDFPKFNLIVTGFVEKFVSIVPSRIKLAGELGTPITEIVSIIPEKKYPFKITDVSAKKGDNIRYDLQETTVEGGGKGYQLTVENTKQDAGRYFDSIILRTDSTIQPELVISLYGNLSAKPKPSEKPVQEKP